jgi:hypothetical protein
MEFLCLKVFFVERHCRQWDGYARCGGCSECQIGEKILLLTFREVPEDDDAVAEDEHLGDVVQGAGWGLRC